MLPEYDDNDVWGDYDYIYGILYKHLRPELDALMENMFANGDSVDKVYSGLLDLVSDRSDNAQYSCIGRDGRLASAIAANALREMDHPRYIAAYCIEHYTPSDSRRVPRVSRRNRRHTDPKKCLVTGEYDEYLGPAPKALPKVKKNSDKRRKAIRR